MTQMEAVIQSKDMKRELPDGWRWMRLGEVCELNPRRPMIQRNDGEPTSFIPMEAIDAVSGTVADLRTRPFGEIKKGYTCFSDGDVLFAKITPCMQNGKHAIAQGLTSGIGFGTTEFHVLRPSGNICPEWIHFFVRQPAFLHEATEHFTGAVGQQRLPQDFLARHSIPLPPLSEQQRIAATLRDQMASVEKARTAAQERLEAVKSLPAALLRKIFPQPGQPLPDGWQCGPIGSVAKVQGGYAFKSEWFSNKGIRLLRNTNIFQDQIVWKDVQFLPLSLRSDFPAYELNVGDIVLALDRPFVSAGLKIAKLSEADTPSLLVQRVGRFRIHGEVLSDFFFYFLHSQNFISAITGHDYSLGVPHISPDQVESICIPLPSLSVQEQIVEKLKGQITFVEKARSAAEEELATIDALPAALLRRAFSGEL